MVEVLSGRNTFLVETVTLHTGHNGLEALRVYTAHDQEKCGNSQGQVLPAVYRSVCTCVCVNVHVCACMHECAWVGCVHVCIYV